MTPKSTHAFIRKVKDITIGSTLALAILGSSIAMQGCGNNSDDDYSYEEVEVYTKGVKTYISETSKGVFKITDETEVPIENSLAVVTYLDGKKDTLSPKAVKALIDQGVSENHEHVGRSHSLSNALLHGGMGFLLARTLSPGYARFRPDMNGVANDRDRTRGYYASGNAYNKSSEIHQNISQSRTTVSRPIGGRNGFFKSSRHGSNHS